MSPSFSKPAAGLHRWIRLLLSAIGIGAWVIASFLFAQLVVVAALYGLKFLGVSVTALAPAILNTLIAAVVYALSIAIVIGAPWLLRRRTTTRADIGLRRLPVWRDILLAPAGFIIYFVLSTAIGLVALTLFPLFNAAQPQDIGYQNLVGQLQILLAFFTLVVVAPVSEEILMRGYLYGKLRRIIPVWGAVLLTSVVFGVLHGQWNVGIDVFALSVVLCTLRELTGSIWAGVLLHMLKNGLAFYILFINPSLLHTIGG